MYNRCRSEAESVNPGRENMTHTASVEVGTAQPALSGWLIFDNVRESCLKN
jgi:hypothetical protein